MGDGGGRDDTEAVKWTEVVFESAVQALRGAHIITRG